MARPKREYSRDFTPKTGKGVTFSAHRIPVTLMQNVRAKSKREGVSLRAMVLRRFTEYLEQAPQVSE